MMFWLISFSISEIIYRYFEKPILNWRDSKY